MSFPENNIAADGKSQIRIFVVVSQLDIGGTERHLAEVLPKLDREKFDLSVQTIRGGGALEKTLTMAGIPVTAPAGSSARWIQHLATGLSLCWRLRTRKPDIVHFFLPEAYVVGGLAGIICLQKNMIMSRRSLNTYQWKYRGLARLERWLHKRMAVLVGNSQAVIDQLKSEAGTAANISLIYNGKPPIPAMTADERAEIRAAAGIGEEEIVLAMIANLIPYKGHEDLLAALSGLRQGLESEGEEMPPWRLYCIGRDDGIGNHLKVISRRLEIENNIWWTGEQDDIAPYLAMADIAISPSHEEGFSNSILEYMAAGLPVVTTRVGGNAEAVVHNETGLLVAPHSPDALGRAIKNLAEDRSLRVRFGQNGRHRLETFFSIDRCVADYEKLYTHHAAKV